MTTSDLRTHEITFCGRVARWAESVFREDQSLPFDRVEIEESKGTKRKRSDIRVYGSSSKPILAGEVKLPGTVEGRNPYESELVQGAFLKASGAGAQFFFTWNVNRLVLFDSSLWDKPLYERRVKEFELGLDLDSPDDVSRSEVEKRIQAFLHQFFNELAQIVRGEKRDWGITPDDYFIRAFESHISWPVRLTAEYLWARSSEDKRFDNRLQEWMSNDQGWAIIRNDAKLWRTLIDRAARTLCYVFSNRLLFYESVRSKFSRLRKLSMPKTISSAGEVYIEFQKMFQGAVETTGDYETLFYPQEDDWLGPTIFGQKDSADAWRSVLHYLEEFNFSHIPTDILGGIFKRLIAPEERHKFGQHYTSEDLVDVINAFCIRNADDKILDPACGSGSFLVRAYQRKSWLKPSVPHKGKLAEIYGVDISLFAAHLSTLNLAARDINDEENYPRIARRNFFELKPNKPFCIIPQGSRQDRKISPVYLSSLNAVIGNPPYVRQELIPKRSQRGTKAMQSKEDLQELCSTLWPRLNLSGRSDLHCYFWPVSTKLLVEEGWFGFLVSSSWLDVEYGFALQNWVLRNFKIHAILESDAEPWFEDSRVKTCAVILQRCSDGSRRQEQLVKFVRLNVPLKQILGERKDEESRQRAADSFRDIITSCTSSISHQQYRVIVRRQGELLEEGLKAARLFALQKQRDLAAGTKKILPSHVETNKDNDEADGESESISFGDISSSGYGGGKWGKYLRAPDLYFQLMEKYGNKFVPLGEITIIRRGITSGCDAFFMPKDVSEKFLQDFSSLEWNDAPIYTSCKRGEVESGKVKLIQAGDRTVHPVETKYLAPEVHSLMNVTRPIISAKELDRLILLVSQPMEKLRGTYVFKYLSYGKGHTFASKKSKAVPVPKRTTCAARDPWYDLTKSRPGAFFWPMAQQYRHVIPSNPESLICNHNLFDVHPIDMNRYAIKVLTAVVNSTLVANFKTFYGRYAGTEGNLKTEVVDVNLLEIPDPRAATEDVAAKLTIAFDSLCKRDTRPMVEEEFMECRSPERAKKLAEKPVSLPKELGMTDRRELDLAVFELLGVSDPEKREKLCDELYYETAAHFRRVRVVEIQKQEQRSKSDDRSFRTDEIAADLWDALSAEEKQPLIKWIADKVRDGEATTIPEGSPNLPDSMDMLEASTIFFRQGRQKGANVTRISYPSRAHAEIIYLLASRGYSGELRLPRQESVTRALQRELETRLTRITSKLEQLSHSRTSDEKRIADLRNLFQLWIFYGKPGETHDAKQSNT